MPLAEVNGIELYYESQGAGEPLLLIGGLGLSRADVLGISLGGRIAMSLALDHPGLVNHLLVVSTGPRAAPHRWRVRLGITVSRLPVLRGENARPRHAALAQFRATSEFGCTNRLGEITRPTLIVHGRADRVAPVAQAREMHAAIPGSRCVLIDGGHLIALLPHHQEQVVVAVRGFLSTGGGGCRGRR
jgi:pimeloyl-ACP methyl ester carboxylesterase